MEYKNITDLAFTYIGLVTTMTKHYVEEGVPLIFNSSIKMDGIDTSRNIFLDDEFAEKNKNRKHKKGDVVTVHTGDIGVSAIISEELDGSLGFATIVTRINDKNTLLPEYLCAFLNYGGGKEQLKKYSRDVRNNLNLADYNRLILPVPNITKQQEIVKQVARLNRIISSRKQQLNYLDDLIKSRFIEQFGDCRTNPMGWKTKQLDDIADVGSSRRVFVEELQSEGIPFFRGTEVGILAEGKHIEPELFITEEHYKALCEATGAPQKGDLLMPSICKDGRIWVVDTDVPFYFKDGRVLWVHNIDSSYDSTFLLYTLKDRIMSDYGSIASGTTFAELKIFALKKCKVFDVPIEKQEKFSAFIKQVDKQKFVIQKSLEETQLLFDALMQQYFG